MKVIIQHSYKNNIRSARVKKNKDSSFARAKYFRDKRHRLTSFKDLGGCKVRKNEVPSHAQTCYILNLTRGSAIGTLLNVTLLAYSSDEKLNPAHANFPNHGNRSSQKKN